MTYEEDNKLADIMIEELESVFRCDEDGNITDELEEKYNDLYRRVSRIFWRINNG